MHPLLFWSLSTAELAERERNAALLRAQRDSGTEQPPPPTRDDRWRAAIQRWAAVESAQTARDTPDGRAVFADSTVGGQARVSVSGA